MDQKKLGKILKLKLSSEIKRAIEEICSSYGTGEMPKEAEKRIRNLLELEADLLDTEAGLFGDLSVAASQFIGEVKRALTPNFDETLQASKERARRRLKDFTRYAKARIDSLEV